MRANKRLSQYTPEEIRRLIRETLSGPTEMTEQVKEKESLVEKEKNISHKGHREKSIKPD